jgi:hypothetical protein
MLVFASNGSFRALAGKLRTIPGATVFARK